MADYGLFEIRVNGTVYQAEGSYTHHKMTRSATASMTSDAKTVNRTFKATAPYLEMDFRKGGFSWTDSLFHGSVDVVVTDQPSGRQMLINNAQWIGEDITVDSDGMVKNARLTYSPNNFREYA